MNIVTHSFQEVAMQQERYISLQDAARQLDVARGTLDYYLRRLEIERKKFPLDRHVYILLDDFERIRKLRTGAIERQMGQQDAA
jgi:hypothetical protein